MFLLMLDWVIFSKAFTGNFLIRLVAAGLLGGAIGLERDMHGRAAGLRTNMLVSLGSALFMLISEAVALLYSVSGAGLFELAIVVTLIGLFTLIAVSNQTDLSRVIDTVKREHLKILHLDYERDYQKDQMMVVFNIRLFHRGVPDKLSHKIIGDLESSGLPIQRIKWWH